MRVVNVAQWQTVCTTADLIPNAGICVLVNGQQVAIFYIPTMSPSLYAIGNWDPVGRANVLSRGIVAEIGGTLTVASPLYKQHFSLSCGRCLEDDELFVPVYNVGMDGQHVRVRV